MLQNFSWVIDGLVAGMAFPASAYSVYADFLGEEDHADLERALVALKQERVSAIVSLTQAPLDLDTVQRFGLDLLHLPVDDMEAPSPDQIQQFVEYVDRVKARGGGVVVHCGAGAGRTGTMLACYLVSLGRTADEAIVEVRRRRPGSIETIPQERAIRDYADRLTAEREREEGEDAGASPVRTVPGRRSEPRLQSAAVRSARPEELGRVIEVCAAAFSARDGRDRRADFERRVASDPDGEFVETRVLVVNEEIVTVLRVYDRMVRIGRCSVRCAGVGDVATDPAWQGRGSASHLVSETVHTLRERGFDLAWLTGRSDFYSRFGWINCPGEVFEVTRVRPPRQASTSCQVTRLDIERDRDAVAEIYDRFNDERTYTVVRSAAYWQWLARYRFLWDPARLILLGAYRDDHLVGYLRAERRDQELRLLEVGCLPPDTGEIAALIRAAGEMAVREGAQRCRGVVPLTPDSLTLLRRGGIEGRLTAGASVFGNVMMQVVNLTAFLERITPELESRLKKARRRLWDGRIAIRTPERDRAILAVEGSAIQVVEQGTAPVELTITPSLLVPMLLGHRSFAEISRHLACPPPHEVARLFAVLFPRLYPVYWGTDYV